VGADEVIVRQMAHPIKVPGVVSDIIAPILAPDRVTKESDGRFPPREFLQKLRMVLGVHALCTYHSLNVLYGNVTKARDDVADAAGMSYDHLRRIGMAHISDVTLFDTESEIAGWAKQKFKDIPVGAQVANNRVRATAELSSVALVGKAYVRAQRVIASWEEAQVILSKSGDAASRAAAEMRARDVIGRGYASAWYDMSVGNLAEIAIYADINPVILWPQHIAFFAELFELARFIGRINAGVGATLSSNLYALTRQVMDGSQTGDTRDLVSTMIRYHLSSALGKNELITAIDAAEKRGLTLSIARGTMRIDLVQQPAVEIVQNGRLRTVFTALKSGFTRGIGLLEKAFTKSR
jgi:hypothetical protein